MHAYLFLLICVTIGWGNSFRSRETSGILIILWDDAVYEEDETTARIHDDLQNV